MVDIIIKTAVTFFAIYGFVCIIRDIAEFFVANRRFDDDVVVVIKVKNAANSLEATVRLVMWRWLALTRGSQVPNILIVDLGSTDETCEISKRLSDDYSFIQYTTKEIYDKSRSDTK